jgi:hypothetical protein
MFKIWNSEDQKEFYFELLKIQKTHFWILPDLEQLYLKIYNIKNVEFYKTLNLFKSSLFTKDTNWQWASNALLRVEEYRPL